MLKRSFSGHGETKKAKISSILPRFSLARLFISAALCAGAVPAALDQGQASENNQIEQLAETQGVNYSVRAETLNGYEASYDHSGTMPHIESMLTQQGGVFFGETHSEPLAAHFMTSHMADFKNSGVQRFYVELGFQHQARLFDDFNARLDGADEALIEVLRARWEKYGSFKPRIDMILAAREAGIAVIPIDMPRIDYPVLRDLHDQWIAPILEGQGQGGNYMIYGGSLHSWGENGVGQILGIPRVKIAQQQGAFYSDVAFEARTSLVVGGDNPDLDFRLVHSIHPEQIASDMIADYQSFINFDGSWPELEPLMRFADTQNGGLGNEQAFVRVLRPFLFQSVTGQSHELALNP